VDGARPEALYWILSLESGLHCVPRRISAVKAIGIEIEERYCEIAAKRMAQEVFAF
jgi:hypothetical protein